MRPLRAPNTVLALLASFSWQELRHHPWRSATAVLAVMLGVALAFSVHLINASALSEFASAARVVSGQPDLTLRAMQKPFDEALYARVATQPAVTVASPVLEIEATAASTAGAPKNVRVVGVDSLRVAMLAPGLMPQLDDKHASRLDLFAPDTVFLNASARQQLQRAPCLTDATTTCVQVHQGQTPHLLRVVGSVSGSGPPLLVMDIGAAQETFGRQGQLSRIDLRLQPGTQQSTLLAALALPSGVQAVQPGDSAERINSLSRAYRVNLTVLALVALFTGAFLVFSVLSLSVAKRLQQFALLGVLGLTGQQRLQLVLAESLVLGLLGSVAGIALGTALAALALRLLGGDLGGGYFAGVAPSLQWQGGMAGVFGGLGVVAALAGGWWPARLAQRLPPAQTLKGLGQVGTATPAHWPGVALLLAGVALAFVPPVGGMPLAAYVAVALLLMGGIAVLPWWIGLLYNRLAPLLAHRLLPTLAIERARRVRESAAVAVSGVVAALSLAVALTVMVTSFRSSVSDWLDVVLPADLYVRSATGPGSGDSAMLPPTLPPAVAALPGVQRLSTLRVVNLQLAPALPSVALISRPLNTPGTNLPLVGATLSVPIGMVGIYVSEPMVDLYGARPGTVFEPLSKALVPTKPTASSKEVRFFVAGVWRDYARQFGAIAIDQAHYIALSGDNRVNDMALWLSPGSDAAQVEQAVRALASQAGTAADQLSFARVSDIRATSLRIFDRSFAVTYWLQAVAIAIGLFGVAASFSAQVLARRKEFGLLAHLGLTRRQILTVVAGEGAAWTLIGSAAGLALGIAVAMVLVFVVNPQSFHWTMDLRLPWGRLLLLCLAVVLAGTVTAWLAGRSAAGRKAVLAVKEDW